MLYTTQPGGFYGGGMGNEGAMRPPAVRFDPSQLNVQPGPGYFNNPAYSPFLQDQDRDRFILHDPRSGVAGNPFGPAFQIPGKRPGGQPVLPGESKEAVEGVYGRPGPQPMPGNTPLGLPMAMGSSNLPNAIGNMAGIANSQFFGGPQFNQPGSQEVAMAFPNVQGRMDAAERLKMYQGNDGKPYFVGPGGRQLNPVEVDRIMKAGVRGA